MRSTLSVFLFVLSASAFVLPAPAFAGDYKLEITNKSSGSWELLVKNVHIRFRSSGKWGSWKRLTPSETRISVNRKKTWKKSNGKKNHYQFKFQMHCKGKLRNFLSKQLNNYKKHARGRLEVKIVYNDNKYPTITCKATGNSSCSVSRED